MCVWLNVDDVNEFTVHLQDGNIVREETAGKDPIVFDPPIPFERLQTNALNHGGWHVPGVPSPTSQVVFKRK